MICCRNIGGIDDFNYCRRCRIRQRSIFDDADIDGGGASCCDRDKEIDANKFSTRMAELGRHYSAI